MQGQAVDAPQHGLRNLFNEALLNPLVWRRRRIDQFTNSDTDTAEARVTIDARIPREWLFGPETEALGRRATDVARARSPLPLIWLTSPLMQFSVRVNGQRVSPYARREAAVLLADSAPRYLITLADGLGISLSLSASELSLIILALAAADPHASRLRKRLREVVEQDMSAAVTYSQVILRENYETWGNAPRSAVDQVIESLEPEIKRLAHSSRRLSGRIGTAIDAASDHHRGRTRGLLMVYPVVFHESMLRMQVSDGQGTDDPAVELSDIRAHLEAFLGRAERWLASIEMATVLVQLGGPSADFAMKYLEVMRKVSEEWLVIADVEVEADTDLAVEVAHTIWTGNMLSRALSDPDCTLRSKAGAIAMAPLHKAWGLVRTVPAWLTSTLGLAPKRKVYTSESTVSFPVTRGDARSYHLEVSVAHPALSLVPRSAYYESDEREYYFKWVKRIAEGCMPGIQSLFPNRKMDVGSIFGRVSDGSERVQHFYTTRLPDEPNPLVDKSSCGPSMSGGSLLVLRYAVPFYIIATNWVLAAGLMLLTGGVIGGFIRPTPELTAADWIRMLAPLYLGTVVLFAVERHNSPVLVHKVKAPAVLVLAALVLFAAAVSRWL